MKKLSWEVRFAIVLIILSVLFYIVHYVVFRDPDHIMLWSMTALAFLPISVLFVTMFVNRILVRRDRKLRLEKLNMIIGIFFDEVGTELLELMASWDPELSQIQEFLVVKTGWSVKDFKRVQRQIKNYNHSIDRDRVDLRRLKLFIKSKRDFLMRLLENPNLFEHERFTTLLRAAFHLAQELEKRSDLTALPKIDEQHLVGDIDRVYGRLIQQWMSYMEYLKNNYPYLFSLAMRTNPFDECASVVVEGEPKVENQTTL